MGFYIGIKISQNIIKRGINYHLSLMFYVIYLISQIWPRLGKYTKQYRERSDGIVIYTREVCIGAAQNEKGPHMRAVDPQWSSAINGIFPLLHHKVY